MPRHSSDWFNAQYDNRARIPEHPAILRHWFDASLRARERAPGLIEVAYGHGPRQRLDVFPAVAAGSPVLVYLRGGYWRALDKRDQSFVAPPFVDAGALVVLPDYSLCPAVTIEVIVLQVVQALDWVYRNAPTDGGDARRIVVAGHSAGGHLATMLLACDWRAVAPDLPADLVKSVLSISGIYELDPLRYAPFLASDLGLTARTAQRLSPARMPAPKGVLAAVVGADESEEFRRQAALIASVWSTPTVTTLDVIAGRNHMSVLGDLAEPSTRTHAWGRRLLGLG
jgi:arylformamidase